MFIVFKLEQYSLLRSINLFDWYICVYIYAVFVIKKEDEINLSTL